MGMLAPMWVAAREGGGGARVGLNGPRAPTGPAAPMGTMGAVGFCLLSFLNLLARRCSNEDA